MKFKIFEVNDDFDVAALHNSIIEHCDKYTDMQMKKISKFAYYKMLEFVKETFNINLFEREISFEGKPHFVDYKMFFNLSHEDNLVAVIIDDEKECGIDLSRRVTNLKLADKILSKAEKEQFAGVTEEDKEEYIARKWAMKEAYGKKIGKGLCEEVFRTTIDLPLKKVTYQDKVYYLCFSE